MRYYYFNPFSKQYYFPVGFRNYPIFATFYQPYKSSAKLLWEIWQASSIFRKIFSTNKPEKVLPIEHIRKYVTPCSILTFNLGTKGIEQKISILGVERTTNTAFYIKYATSEIACKNVFNEGVVLQQLSHLSFVPKLQLNVHKENQFTLIKTTVLKGEKMKHQRIDQQMLTILFTLSTQKIVSSRNYSSEIRSCFSHGDFCPWNMLVNEGKIELFDWELAGEYPLGYDLFMYIFQFEFLVNEMNRFDLMLNQNADAIQQYFKHFEIDNWKPYLKEFSMLKYKLESEKRNSDLIEPYLKLKEFSNRF
jgi:hypothetical protein